MRTLRARLNRFEALYGLGTVFNHSCRPNARRLTDADENVSPSSERKISPCFRHCFCFSDTRHHCCQPRHPGWRGGKHEFHFLTMSLVSSEIRDVAAEVEVTLPYQDFGPSSSAWFRRLVLYYGLPGTAHAWIANMYLTGVE